MHRYVGDHAQSITVGDSDTMVGPGEFVELDKDDLKNPNNKRLVDEDSLIVVKEKE